MKSKKKCVLLLDEIILFKIEKYLKDYTILHGNSLDEVINIIRIYPIEFAIIYTNSQIESLYAGLKRLKNLFPIIPILIILEDQNIDFIKYCCKIGVDDIISEQDLNLIPIKVSNLIRSKITLIDIGLLTNHYSELINRTLELIQEFYIEIKSIQEISDILGVSNNTLSLEFKKHNLISPKKILTLFKLKHTIFLMKNPGLQIKEIAAIAGFSNERRFNECFHRVFGGSPSVCRRSILIGGAFNFWNNNIKKEYSF